MNTRSVTLDAFVRAQSKGLRSSNQPSTSSAGSGGAGGPSRVHSIVAKAPVEAPVPTVRPPSVIPMVGNRQEEWIVCSEVSLALMREARGKQKCISCDEIVDCGGVEMRSEFWIFTKCHGGHGPRRPEEIESGTSLVLCKKCDKDYALRVVKGQQVCRRQNCRRAARVLEFQITNKLSLLHSPGLIRKFLALVDKYKTYECTIHGDEVKLDEGFPGGNLPPTGACAHDRQVCNPCLKATFEAAIQGDRLNDLVCPDVECRMTVKRDVLRELVSREHLRLYDRKLAFQLVAQNPKFRWCSCGLGTIHEPGELEPEWQCITCKMRNCFICRGGNHDICEHLARNKARREHQKSEAMLAIRSHKTRETTREIARTAKRCPSAPCQAPIQRNGGCAHMCCCNCKTHFCWACKVIWKPEKTSPKTPVPLHLDTCSVAKTRKVARSHLDTTGYAVEWSHDPGYEMSLDSDLWLPKSHS